MNEKNFNHEVKVYMSQDEIKKIFNEFPIYYWMIVLITVIIETIILALICIFFKSEFILFFASNLIFILITIIGCKLQVSKIIETYYRAIVRNKKNAIEYTIELGDDCIEQKIENYSKKFYYSNIIKIIETDTNFYIKFKRKMLNIPKDNTNIEIDDFIRKINIKNYINKLGKNQIVNKQIFIKNPRYVRLLR